MESTLSHYFGYDTFRPGQKEIISKVMDQRNVLGCYQLVVVNRFVIKYQV